METERHWFAASVVLSCLIIIIEYTLYINYPRSYYASTSYVDQMYISQTIDAVRQHPTTDSELPPINGMQPSPAQHSLVGAIHQSTTDGGQHGTTDGHPRPAPNAMLYSTTDTTQHSTIRVTQQTPFGTAQNPHNQLPTTSAGQQGPTDAIHHSSIVGTSAIQHIFTDSMTRNTQLASPTVDNNGISAPSLPVSLTNGYDGASLNFATKDLIVRAAYSYFDNRRRGSHRNIIVFLIEVRKSILKQNLITGCAVGDHWTRKFEVLRQRPKITGWVHEHHPELSHDTVLVNCFNLPVQIGGRASNFRFVV